MQTLCKSLGAGLLTMSMLNGEANAESMYNVVKSSVLVFNPKNIEKQVF